MKKSFISFSKFNRNMFFLSRDFRSYPVNFIDSIWLDKILQILYIFDLTISGRPSGISQASNTVISSCLISKVSIKSMNHAFNTAKSICSIYFFVDFISIIIRTFPGGHYSQYKRMKPTKQTNEPKMKPTGPNMRFIGKK